MKFLPSLSPLALVSLALALSSCANPANRRELYNTSLADNGPWHDYERRRQAEAVTGVNGGTAPTVVPGTRGRPTAPPPSSALPAGTTAAPASVGAPVPVNVTETTSTNAPPVPVNPPGSAAGGTPAPDAAPGALPPAVPDATPAAPAATPPAP